MDEILLAIIVVLLLPQFLNRVYRWRNTQILLGKLGAVRKRRR